MNKGRVVKEAIAIRRYLSLAKQAYSRAREYEK